VIKKKSAHISVYKFGEVSVPEIVHIGPSEQRYSLLICLK